MSDLPILIVGGAGKTGSRVNERLLARGIVTRLVSRSTPIAFDWTRPQTWNNALEGASKAYVAYQPDIGVDGAPEAIMEFGRVAREKGLERLVLLSGRGEPNAQAAEVALQTSGLDWTIVRASWFNQNFSEGYLVESVLAGEVALPVGAVPEPFVDVDDVADVVAAALTDERHANKIYEVTGPRALTFADAVAEIAGFTGRPIRYTRITHEGFIDGMRKAGLPDDHVALLDELFRVVLDGRNANATNDIEKVLERPARDFSGYARAAAATGVWGA